MKRKESLRLFCKGRSTLKNRSEFFVAKKGVTAFLLHVELGVGRECWRRSVVYCVSGGRGGELEILNARVDYECTRTILFTFRTHGGAVAESPLR